MPSRVTLASAVQGVSILAYPFLVYLALGTWTARTTALCLLGVLALRIFIAAPERARAYIGTMGVPAILVTAALLLSAAWNDPLALRLAPSLMNLALLLAFARTLRAEQTFIEQIARAQHGSLSDREIVYCRHVTIVWCVFFSVNGTLALWLALTQTIEAWTLYTGLIAYLLVGLLYALEAFYRHWLFRYATGAPSDWIFRQIFPPRSL